MKHALTVLRWFLSPPVGFATYLLALLIGTLAIFSITGPIIGFIADHSWKWWHMSAGDVLQQTSQFFGWYGFIPADCLASYLAVICAFRVAPNNKTVAAYLIAALVLCLHILLFVVFSADVYTSNPYRTPSLTAQLLSSLACSAMAVMQIRPKQSAPDIQQSLD